MADLRTGANLEPANAGGAAFVRTQLANLTAALRAGDQQAVTRVLTLLILEAPDAAAALACQLSSNPTTTDQSADSTGSR